MKFCSINLLLSPWGYSGNGPLCAQRGAGHLPSAGSRRARHGCRARASGAGRGRGGGWVGAAMRHCPGWPARWQGPVLVPLVVTLVVPAGYGSARPAAGRCWPGSPASSVPWSRVVRSAQWSVVAWDGSRWATFCVPYSEPNCAIERSGWVGGCRWVVGRLDTAAGCRADRHCLTGVFPVRQAAPPAPGAVT
jgi:hypothetical protein